MPSRILPTRADSRTAKSEAAARAEQNLLDSIKFDDSQLDWVYENFERSPSAALAFLAANTGVAHTPADLGPLIDGVLENITLQCVKDFMRATDISRIHSCACCGMRTTD